MPASSLRPHFRRLFIAIGALSIQACGLRDAIESFNAPRETAHERYAHRLRDAGLDSTALGREWLAAADTVLRNPLRITLPHHETGYYDRSEARAVGWQFTERDGRRIEISIAHDGQQATLFADLFKQTADTANPFKLVTSGTSDSLLHHDTRDSATYILRLQPELLRSGRYDITIRSSQLLGFPVKGIGNSAAQSFWGASRDAGAREHKGVDIFAPRGTPVVAASDGDIVNTTPSNLGGNVVWQSDAHRGQSLYYAHLDRVAVSVGTRVNTGDTIGFVGNTGNARTTAPHLHFGIYRRGQGPINPWPYVQRIKDSIPAIRADTARIGQHIRVGAKALTLRVAPDVRADSVAFVTRNELVWVKGAASNFYRVELDNGTAGYVSSGSALTPVSAKSR